MNRFHQSRVSVTLILCLVLLFLALLLPALVIELSIPTIYQWLDQTPQINRPLMVQMHLIVNILTNQIELVMFLVP